MGSMEKPTYTTSFAFFEAIWEAGITHVFVNLGSDHPSIMEAIVKGQNEKHGDFPRIITCPNEMVALSMADGYARLTNKPQCVIVHVDVGTQGLAAAVHNASCGRAPVLIFAGLSPYTIEGEHRGSRTEYIHWIQDVPDQKQIIAQYCRYTGEIKTGRNVKQMVNRALQFATSDPQGPVYLCGAREPMEQDITPYKLNQDVWGGVTPAPLPMGAVPMISKYLVDAHSPLLILGYTGRKAESVRAATALADAIPGLRVLDTGGSDMCFPADHPAWLGMRYGTDDAITTADFILVVDCDVPWVPTRCKPREDCPIVHIDVDPLKQQMPVFYISALARFKADATTAFTQLHDYICSQSELSTRLKGKGYIKAREERLESHKARINSIKKLATISPDPASESINPHVLGGQIRAAVPHDTIFAIEAVTLSEIIADQIAATLPKSWINCGGGGLGWSGGGALGIKLATDFEHRKTKSNGVVGSGDRFGTKQGKFVCQIVGDGTFLFSVPGSVYWIAQRYDIPILTIVLNNKGWNAPRRSMLLVHPDGLGSKVDNKELNISFDPTPDYSGIAKAASGGKAWAGSVSTVSELQKELQTAVEAVKSGRCAVLDVNIGAEIVHGYAIGNDGATLCIGGNHYYISSQAAGQLPAECYSLTTSSGLDEEFITATVIDGSSKAFGPNDLNSAVASYVQKDDVFNEAFLTTLIVLTTNRSLVQNLSSQHGIQASCSTTSFSNVTFPPGPYVVSTRTNKWHIPYRLYVDTQGAFTGGVIPAANGSYQSIPAALAASSSMTIGVPSRLYYQPTAQKPLAGVRLGVKDLYDLRGVKTGAGSRAYYDVYSAADTTAPAVQRLIDAGAVIIGKMKTTQFAAPEFANLAIDYQAPFNPRGDGYQEPGSSSSGPGAGLASYDWLDLTLGSDTGGSVRVPAAEQGLYGNRPSHGYVTLDHVFPLGPVFDTAGLLARDPQLWSQACRILYSGLTTNYTSYPRQIQTFGLTAATPSTADAQITAFIQKLSQYLSASVSSLNYTQRWIETRPNGTIPDLSLYLNNTWETLTAAPQVQLVRTSLFRDYAAKYNGRQPYINPDTRAAWNWALSTNPNITSATQQKTTFMNWWNTQILPPSSTSCSTSLVLYVGKNVLGTTGQPSYREAQLPVISPDIVTGLLGGLFISPMSGVPDFVVPIGQVSYNSSITNRPEVLPVTINIMAAKGCDLMLLDLINDLNRLGILGPVKTGNSIEGGQIYL